MNRASRWTLALVLLCTCVQLTGCGTSLSSSSTPNPVAAALHIASISPAAVPAGTASVSLILTGTGFESGTTLQVNGTAIPVTYVSSTEITATVPGSLLASGGTLTIVAANGTTTSGTGASAPALQVDNPAPALTSLAPGGLPAGSPGTTITASGTGFVSSTSVQVNGAARSATYISPTQVTFGLLATDLAGVGSLSVSAINPSPGGGASGTVALPVVNPAPGLSAIAPGTVVAAPAAPVTVTVTGSNFVNGSVVLLNGVAQPITLVSSTQLTFVLSVAELATAGTQAITVATPGPGGGTSPAVSLAVVNPVPGAITLAPATVTAGAAAPTTVAVTGSNFIAGSVAQVNGAARPTTVAGPSQLTFQLTTADVASAANLAITVANAAPGGGTSSPATMAVQPPIPSLVSLTPATANLDSPALTVVLAGTSFTATDVVYLGAQSLSTTFVSAQSLQCTVPAGSLASVASLSLTVRDSATSNGPSNALSLAVVNPVPTLASVSQTIFPGGSATTTVTLYGSGFNLSSAALLGGTPLKTAFVSAGQLTAVIPAASLAASGTLPLTISNSAPGGGVSAPVTITVTAPAPTLTSLSPASVLVDAATPILITVTGQNFSPTTRVVFIDPQHPYIGQQFLPITFVSPGQIQFTLPPIANTTGSFSVAAIDRISNNVDSNALPFQVVNPVPTLTAISPTTVPAGSPNFQLTLTGSNILSTSTVLINGVAHSGDGPVVVAASEVANVGSLQVTVVNPTPGGGTSNTEILNVVAADTRVRTVAASASALGWDPVHSLLLATTYSTSANNPQSLIVIDPLQGTVTASQPLAVPADNLVISSDGAYVYVSLPTSGQVERFLLPALTPDITFSVGTDSSGSPYRAESLCIAPGHPHTVALSRHTQNPAYGATGGVAVFDDGVPRASIATPTGFNVTYDAIVWGADDTTLYGTNDDISTAVEDVFTVTPSGVTLTSATNGALSAFVRSLFFDTSTSRLIDGYGSTVNAVTEQSTGVLPLQNTLIYEQSPFTVDPTLRRAFYLNTNDTSASGNSSDGLDIQAFDIDHYTYLDSLRVPGLLSGGSIVRWGTSGLAINDSSQIYLVDGSFVSPAGTASPVGSYAAPSATLTSAVPAAVPAGSPDTQVTLTGKDFSLASVVSWNNQNLPIDSATATQLVVTIPSSLLASAVAGPITVTNGPGVDPSTPVGFSVLPDLGTGAQINAINISASDMVWDGTRKLLYLAVPGNDPVAANSIAVVDPVAASLVSTTSVLPNPYAISVSSDASFLYIGYPKNAVVQRLALPGLSVDLNIPLGAGVNTNGAPVGGAQSCTFAIFVAAVPGSPHAVAVAQGNSLSEPSSCGALAIFDDATPRPNSVSFPYDGAATFTWGADATTLYGQSDPVIQSQSIESYSVTSAGVTPQKTLMSGSFGSGVHFDPGTGSLYSDSGIISSTDGKQLANLLPSHSQAQAWAILPDSASNRIYFLTGTGANGLSTSFELQIFDETKLTLLNSITLPAVLGSPTQMVRWGADGIAITTVPSSASSSTLPGVLYLLHGAAVTGQ